MTAKKTIGIVGARGHTGTELIRLVANHPGLELAFVSSRELDGQRVAEHNDAYRGELRYASLDPTAVAAAGADVVVLALPNGKAAPYVEAIDAARPDTLVVDVSPEVRVVLGVGNRDLLGGLPVTGYPAGELQLLGVDVEAVDVVDHAARRGAVAVLRRQRCHAPA